MVDLFNLYISEHNLPEIIYFVMNINKILTKFLKIYIAWYFLSCVNNNNNQRLNLYAIKKKQPKSMNLNFYFYLINNT